MKRQPFLFVFYLLVSIFELPSAYVNTTSSCDYAYSWFSLNNKLYAITNNSATFQPPARDCCERLGPRIRLTVLASDDDVIGLMTFIEQNFGEGAHQVWVDATRKQPDANFTWPDGRLVNETLWQPKEPNQGEDCARLHIERKTLMGKKCLQNNYTIFCQGYTPESADRVCDLDFTWMTLSSDVYGISSVVTDLETARQCCSAYGPSFRLAVFDDVSTADVIKMELRSFVQRSSTFWVDVFRPEYNSSDKSTWSNDQTVSNTLWSTGQEPKGQGVAAYLTMQGDVPSLKENANELAKHYALCQELIPPVVLLQDPAQSVAESTSSAYTEYVSAPTDVIWTLEPSKPPSKHTPNETGTISATTTRSTLPSAMKVRHVNQACYCKQSPLQTTRHEAAMQEALHQIVSSLAVNRSTLSKTVRRKISAPDERRSACVIGSVGLLFLIVSLLLVILIDLRSPFTTIRAGVRNKRQ